MRSMGRGTANFGGGGVTFLGLGRSPGNSLMLRQFTPPPPFGWSPSPSSRMGRHNHIRSISAIAAAGFRSLAAEMKKT